MTIGCAILAGGKSSRMGTDKALLAIDGTNFIKKIAGELDAFGERIISRGANSDLSDMGWNVIPDIYEDHGPLGGIHAALSCCQSEALFFVTCDMPFFKHTLADYFCERWAAPDSDFRQTPDAIVAVTPDGRIHPLCGIYHKSVLPVLEKELKANNNKVMLTLKQLNVIYLQIPESMAQMLSNVNTADDYRTLNFPN